jgi:hypothetical protein
MGAPAPPGVPKHADLCGGNDYGIDLGLGTDA